MCSLEMFHYITFMLILNRPGLSSSPEYVALYDAMCAAWFVGCICCSGAFLTYHDGLEKGQENAKSVFRNQCNENSIIHEVEWWYKHDPNMALKLWLLPQWSISVGGDEYIIRPTEFESDQIPEAWVMPLDDSQLLDETLKTKVLSHFPHLSEKSRLTYWQHRDHE